MVDRSRAVTRQILEPSAGAPHATEDLRDQLTRALAGRYVVERQIGRGAMATVYLAREQHPTRRVAIKVLNPQLAHRLGRERFLQEIDIVSNLIHPHIVPIFAAGEVAGHLFYVMPYIDGKSVRARLNEAGRFSARDTIRIGRDVATALDYVHRAEVVHQDIKPENILLADGHALVTDFGVARLICAACTDSFTGSGLAVGTPGYWSPEQASGMDVVDGRSDIYSLARVLLKMTSGELLPIGAADQALAKGEYSEGSTGDLGGSMPPCLQQVLARALAMDPGERYGTAAEVAEVLDSDCGG